MKSVETLTHEDKIIAIIIRSNFHKDGIAFFTPPSFSQQLGYMCHDSGYEIPAHVHNLNKRNVMDTQETLFVKSGRVYLSLYTNEKEIFEERILTTGDIVLLASGGHGIRFLEKSEIIEVKQGPYGGDSDKVRFEVIQ